MKNIIGLSIVLVLVISGCFKVEESTPYGALNGKVTLSPMCADEPCDLTPKELEKIYGDRQLIVYSDDTSKVIQRIDLSLEGGYASNLPEGEYILDINYFENDISPDVPVKIKIMQGFTKRVDINIMTGL